MFPSDFVVEFGEKLPAKVYLHVPSGSSWPAVFERTKRTVGGLQYMFSFYGLTEKNILLLQYCGGSKFYLRIFNCYAVEIEYATGTIPLKNCWLQFDRKNCNEYVREIAFQEIEYDKLDVAFDFNAFNKNEELFDVTVEA